MPTAFDCSQRCRPCCNRRGVGFVAPSRFGGAAPGAAAGVLAPVMPVPGLPWAARDPRGIRLGDGAHACGLALRAAWRGTGLPRHAALALGALALLAYEPLRWDGRNPVRMGRAALETRGLSGSVSVTLALTAGIASSSEAVRGCSTGINWPSRAPGRHRTGHALAARRVPDLDAPIVVLSVDTLRADAARQMDTYARLAQRGATWPSAMATSSWTVPSLVSLWTGHPPRVHGGGAPAGDDVFTDATWPCRTSRKTSRLPATQLRPSSRIHW